MKISYNWLREFVDFLQSPEELAELLTRIGLNVDAIEEVGAQWRGVVVGKVLACESLPGSAYLKLCQVDAGTGEKLPIICGAPNIAPGQIVPVALVGAELPGGFKVGERTLRGVLSRGMICSEKELGIGEDAEGILALEDPPPTPPCNSRGGEIPFKIGAPLEEYVGLKDWVFDIEVTINRGDCLSHLGVAREVSAATGPELKLPPVDLEEIDEQTADKVTVEILAPDRCPRYSARMVKGVTIGPSPLWMRERLRSVGIRPIANVVDVTNYALMELGHPLHAFDYDLVSEGKIIVRTAGEGERFITLDEEEHTLTSTDLLIADPEKPVALAGVMGGLNSGIKADTSEVLLECAYFNPVGIRLTSRDRAIGSESSYRFERGVDPEMTIFAVNRSAYLIRQLTGGEVLKGIVDNYPQPWRPRKINLRPGRVNALLATDIEPAEMTGYLQALGCGVDIKPSPPPETGVGIREKATIKVTTPSWRHDLEREIDLVEEVARLHGYDRIGVADTSAVPLSVDTEREQSRRLVQRFKGALVELGLHEAINFSLVPGTDSERFPDGRQPVILKNPLSEDMSRLRTSLGPSLLRAAERSLRAGCADIRLFEWGKCFRMEEGQAAEGYKLAGVIAGTVRPSSWIEKARPFNIHDMKGMIEQLSSKISLDKVNYIYYDIPEYLKIGGCIAIGEGDGQRIIGRFGQMQPAVSDQFGLDLPVWYFEMDGGRLLGLAGAVPHYRPLPRYPAALRDLSFIIDEDLSADRLEEVIRKFGGELLEGVELFDLFRGKGIPPDKKSLAYHLTFRSAERTLSDSEIDQSVGAVIEAASRHLGAALRSQ